MTLTERKSQARRNLINALRLMAADFELQEQLLPHFVHVPDEVCLVFDQARELFLDSYSDDASAFSVLEALSEINRVIDESESKEDFYTIEAMKTGDAWRDLRASAKAALVSMGESPSGEIDLGNYTYFE